MNTLPSRPRLLEKATLACAPLFCACLLSPAALAAAEPPAPPDDAAPTEPAPDTADASSTEAPEETEPPVFRNWIDFGLGGFIRSGDQASFRQRHRSKDVFGGIEDLHLEQDLGKKGLIKLDGRGIFDNHDYAIRLEAIQQDLGFIRGGYEEHRSWYNGAGGYFPPTDTRFSLDDDTLFLDRGQAWVEGGLNIPDWPRITLRYSHDFRRGEKNSTVWGFSTLTGGLGTRGIVPAFREIDEKRDTIEGRVSHTVGNTDLGLGLRYEWYQQDNAMQSRQFPGEGAPNDLFRTTREEVKSDLFNIHASSVTRFNPRTFFSVGYGFTTMDTDLGGSRIYGFDFDSAFNPALVSPMGYFALTGGSQLRQHVASLNLMLTPVKNLFVIPSVRIEREDIDSVADFTATPGTGVTLPTSASGDRGVLDVSERLEVRYAGVTNWVFYARGDWAQAEGSLTERGGIGPVPPIVRVSDDERITQKYTVGATWYPLRKLNLDAQYYHKIRDVSYDHEFDSTANTAASANRYPAYFVAQDFDMDDVNARITFRPWGWLSLVTRYDFQYLRWDITPDDASGLDQTRGAATTSHIIGESVTFIPWSRLFFQVGLNYVASRTDSETQEATPAVTASKNNYFNGTVTTGLVVDDKTDLQTSYFYYRADDFQDNSAVSVPYGADAEEHGITVSLIRRITPQLRWTLRYGYFKNRESGSGNLNNYEAHLVSSGVQYRF